MTGKDQRAVEGAASPEVLRRQAEARLLKKAVLTPENVAVLSPEATRKLLHELQVHQIELEMQNEELRESQAALEGVRARYFDLYDLAPVGYCTVSEAGLILQANLSAATLLGITRGELVRRPLSRFILREDQDIYFLHSKRLAGADQVQSCELRMLRQDGAPVWVHLTATTAQGADGAPELLVVLNDISARKRQEMLLVKSDALQSAIFNSANFSSIATDQKGVIQIFNVGAERMLGYAASEVMNKLTPADLSDPRELIERARLLSAQLASPIAPGFEALVFKATRGIEDIYELTYIRRDGVRVPAVVSVTALRDPQNAILGYLLIGTDNTARKQVETERNAAVAIAQKASQAKSDFLSSMSHELRTPLNAILGFAQLMQSSTPPPTDSQQRSIERILKSGWYLLELINEILDLARIEAGNVILSQEPVALAAVLLECRAMIESEAQERGIALTFPPHGIPHFLSADRTRLKQVLINLLSNAVKYNRPGGAVTVECKLAGSDAVAISVSDTGLGLAPEQIAQLFQPFNRLGREAGTVEGTGIGLVVSRQLVEMMGGRIEVQSTVGVGSRFGFEMRLSTAPRLDPALLEHAAPARRPLPAGKAQRTLLYVEDNPSNLELVAQIIARRPDLRLLAAVDGTQGIELARAHLPAVILMDINLPGISGIDAMKILHADPATRHIPIIALSANAMPHDVQKALAAGFSSYITKPFNVQQFVDTLDAGLALAAKAANPRT